VKGYKGTRKLKVINNIILFTVLSLLYFSNIALSKDIYKWVDENGVTHFSNTEAGVPEKFKADDNAVRFKGYHNIGRDSNYNYEEPTTEHLQDYQFNGEGYLIPFTAYEGSARRIIVPVTLNNSVTANFALDTGSPGMIISSAMAKRLGLYENDSGMLLSVARGIGGQVAVMRTIIDEVQIGGAKETFVPASITPDSMSKSFEGLIGMDFMGNYSISIDNINNFIVLRENIDNSDMPAGHSQKWWKNTFKEFKAYRDGWFNLSELIRNQTRNSIFNIDLGNKDIKKLQELVEWQYQESTKLLNRLESYAREHEVPNHWRN